MGPDLRILTTAEGREPEIVALFTETFAASEGAGEGAVIGTLARDLIETTGPEDLHLFCALDGAALAACIIFSRLTYANDPRSVFVIGPVAVHPDRQGQGIGRHLIARGLNHLRTSGVDVALNYGDPAFYSRVGFRPITETQVAPPFPLAQPHGWQGQSLTDRPLDPLSGPVACVSALDKPAYW